MRFLNIAELKAAAIFVAATARRFSRERHADPRNLLWTAVIILRRLAVQQRQMKLRAILWNTVTALILAAFFDRHTTPTNNRPNRVMAATVSLRMRLLIFALHAACTETAAFVFRLR
jgi:hypothetical protein